MASAQAAMGLGANAQCRPNYPPPCPTSCETRSQPINLETQVNGGKVVEVHRDWAVIDRPVNRSQRIFYRRDVDEAKAALPWTLPQVKTG
jgi:hypothetical protein